MSNFKPADSRQDTSVCSKSHIPTPDEDITERRGKGPLATKWRQDGLGENNLGGHDGVQGQKTFAASVLKAETGFTKSQARHWGFFSRWLPPDKLAVKKSFKMLKNQPFEFAFLCFCSNSCFYFLSLFLSSCQWHWTLRGCVGE